MNGGNSVDRIKSVELEKLEDISYKIVINVSPFSSSMFPKLF